jgi:hypothetical protein
MTLIPLVLNYCGLSLHDITLQDVRSVEFKKNPRLDSLPQSFVHVPSGCAPGDGLLVAALFNIKVRFSLLFLTVVVVVVVVVFCIVRARAVRLRTRRWAARRRSV